MDAESGDLYKWEVLVWDFTLKYSVTESEFGRGRKRDFRSFKVGP